MQAATRPPMPGGMMGQANGPTQGPGPMPHMAPPGGQYMQQPQLGPPSGYNNHQSHHGGMPYSSTNGTQGPPQPGVPGMMPGKMLGPGPMLQQPMGPGPARPPSANGNGVPMSQPMPSPYGGINPPAPSGGVGMPQRPGSSQGMNPAAPNSFYSAPQMNATAPTSQYARPSGMGEPQHPQPSMSPYPQGQGMGGPTHSQAPGGIPPHAQPLGMGGPPQPTYAAGPRMSTQSQMPYAAGPGMMAPRPTQSPLPTPGSAPLAPGMGYPQPSRPAYQPGPPGPAFQPGQPLQQPMMNPSMGPPRPGMPPAPGMQPAPGPYPPMPGGPMSGPTGMAGPPRPGMPPQLPSGPGMPPQPGGYPTQLGPPTNMGGNQMSSPAGRRTLDPDQMPSPIYVMEDDQKNNGGDFTTKEKGQVPPLVTTKFVAQDHGNATPRFVRSTMYTVPATEELRKQSGVPLALVLTPMAKVAEGEVEPPVTDFGPTGPVRCIRCKAYMSPFMQFIDGGRRFQCAFCKATSEVPADYFQHLDHTGSRLDRYQRPELCLGTYECVATKDYCRDSKEPNTPGIIFAIDVSYPMVKEGVVQLICANIKSMLSDLPRDPHCDKDRMRVGFMTYDNKINFYNIKGNLSQPQQLTVGDVDDMFVPLVDGLMCSVEESDSVIDSLLEQIPHMFAETRETETILAPVIQAGKEAFKAANCAGKLIVFHHNLPVAEAPGKLKNRDERKVLGTEKEKTVLTPQCKDYNTLGQDCVGVGCTVDMFLFNNAYIDVATISQVCRLSGGQLYKYTYFQLDLDSERFLADLRHNLSRPVVFDAIMRVRTSTGVRPVEFFGNFYMANTTDTELASLNSDMAIACEIKYDDKLTEEDGVYIQAALLFTSCSGQRRLRVINLSLNTSSSMADMYRNCELDTIINFQAKQSISKLMETNPKSVKESLIATCAQILACYRKNCASPSSAGQLILPECMKLLPLYTNCLLKSDALSGGADVGCDDRAFLMHSLGSMDVSSSVAYFYPRLIPLHDLSPEEDEDRATIPHPLRCSIEKVSDDGVYILENGVYMFMYIGLAVNPAWVHDVFGVQTAAQINVEKPTLEERDNALSRQVRAIINLIRKQRERTFMRVVLVRQRDKLDILFRHFLCEDRSSPGSGAGDLNFSYVDFLCHMHKEIRALLG